MQISRPPQAKFLDIRNLKMRVCKSVSKSRNGFEKKRFILCVIFCRFLAGHFSFSYFFVVKNYDPNQCFFWGTHLGRDIAGRNFKRGFGAKILEVFCRSPPQAKPFLRYFENLEEKCFL